MIFSDLQILKKKNLTQHTLPRAANVTCITAKEGSKHLTELLAELLIIYIYIINSSAKSSVRCLLPSFAVIHVTLAALGRVC